MLKLSPSATLLTLFTSPEQAQSIEGDLLEEARSRGRLWFWSHVVRTTLALWWTGFSGSPLALLGLTVACGAAWFLLLFLGEVDDSPGLSVFGTILVGFVFVRAVPTRGIYAAVAVAFLAGPTIAVSSFLSHLPVEGVTDIGPDVRTSHTENLRLALADGVFVVGPLLLGSLVARRLVVRKLPQPRHRPRT